MLKLPKIINTGITLIEILIALSISIVIGGLVLLVLVNSSGVQYTQSAKISQGLGVNDALQQIRNSTKQAQSIVTGYPESSPIYTTGTNILAFKLPSIDVSEDVIDNVFDYYVYIVEDDQLKEKIFPNVASNRQQSDLILASNVDYISFGYFNNADQIVSPEAAEKIVVTIKLSQKAGADIESLIATSEARLRNN